MNIQGADKWPFPFLPCLKDSPKSWESSLFQGYPSNTSTGWSWSLMTPVNRFYTITHSFAKLWKTILEAAGISHGTSAKPSKELREGGRAKQGPRLITCCMQLMSAHYFKPLVYELLLRTEWGHWMSLSNPQHRAGAIPKTTGPGCATAALRVQNWMVSSSQRCVLPRKGESPVTELGLTDSLQKANGICLLCKSS